MGNGCCKFVACFSAGGREVRRRKENSDEGFGHSFLYVRPDQTRISSSKVHSEEETTTFRTISGASVSANISTPPSTLFPPFPSQPIPRGTIYSGPIISGSGPIIPGFLSGPIDRAGFFMSGPLEKTGPDQFQRSVSGSRVGSRNGSMIRFIRRAISKRISLGGGGGQNPIMGPIKGSIPPKEQPDWVFGSDHTHNENLTVNSLSTLMSSEGSSLLLDDGVSMESQNLQWAQGKAGEDRVHVVVSEEHKCVFVGIYDGFNGPDAPDYLMSNLYPAVHTELKGLLWDDNNKIGSENQASPEEKDFINESCSEQNSDDKSNIENHRRWRCQWKNEMLIPEKSTAANHHPEKSTAADHHPEKSTAENHPPEKLTDVDHNPEKSTAVNHQEVLNALSEALRKTEEAYLENADKMLDENPELALMGSCVLVMLMKGEDVYVMNVGDSRAVLGQNTEPEFWLGKIKQDLERINEETMNDLEERSGSVPSLGAFQLTFDHSTSIEEEVERIWNEHPDDSCAVTNERVKGSLQVTRAFGAGFLKQPKWNDALLEMFRIDYIGTSPYINCLPSLYHHRLGPKDRFLILSSDGLYQYFTNEEAVSEVELFITLQPEGDPAQHLVEELLFRAAKKAGMDFHELLEIPQGERRRYHDDVSIIIISFEGRIWRSCV